MFNVTKLQMGMIERKITVLSNVLKMIYKRGLIDETKLNSINKKFIEIIKNTDIFELKDNNNNKWSINLIYSKLNSVNKGSPLEDYLTNSTSTNKIIVISYTTKKLVKQIRSVYYNSEVFNEYEMLEDISEKSIIPEHQVLT